MSEQVLTEEVLKDKYQKRALRLLDEYDEAPIKAYGRDTLSGDYIKSKNTVLQEFKATNALYLSLAKRHNIKLDLVDTSTMIEVDDDPLAD
tara:strand:- start:539 stop:811 length:273 start_codon:yes stop_codon:yes gene_type:complete